MGIPQPAPAIRRHPGGFPARYVPPAMPVMAAWVIALLLARERETGPPWWLLAVMVVWANLHGAFVVGQLAAAAAEKRRMRAAKQRRELRTQRPHRP